MELAELLEEMNTILEKENRVPKQLIPVGTPLALDRNGNVKPAGEGDRIIGVCAGTNPDGTAIVLFGPPSMLKGITFHKIKSYVEREN